MLNHSFMQIWHQPYLFLDICQYAWQFKLCRWFFCYNFRSTLQLHGLWCNSFPLWKCSSILTLLPACNLIKDSVSALITLKGNFFFFFKVIWIYFKLCPHWKLEPCFQQRTNSNSTYRICTALTHHKNILVFSSRTQAPFRRWLLFCYA